METGKTNKSKDMLRKPFKVEKMEFHTHENQTFVVMDIVRAKVSGGFVMTATYDTKKKVEYQFIRETLIGLAKRNPIDFENFHTGRSTAVANAIKIGKITIESERDEIWRYYFAHWPMPVKPQPIKKKVIKPFSQEKLLRLTMKHLTKSIDNLFEKSEKTDDGYDHSPNPPHDESDEPENPF